MALDPKITEAINSAVADHRQPESLARSIASWMTAITSGGEDQHDPASIARHAEVLYQETEIKMTDEA